MEYVHLHLQLDLPFPVAYEQVRFNWTIPPPPSVLTLWMNPSR